MQVTLYTSAFCPFCIRAKALLDERGVAYEEHVMDAEPEELQRVKLEHDHSTVPIILIDGTLIGGYDELRALESAGGLG